MSVGRKFRRGVLFGGLALIFSMIVIPLVVGLVRPGPLEPGASAALWAVIGVIAATGFYLGYSGWGQYGRR